MSKMKELWVYVTAENDVPDQLSESLLSNAQRLAKEGELLLCAVLAGKDIETAAKRLADRGVPKVYSIHCSDVELCESKKITNALQTLVERVQPEIFLFPANDCASIVASSLGVRLKTGVNVHCVSASIRDGIFIGAVPAFGGQVMSEILCPQKRPQMATVRLSDCGFITGKPGEVVDCADCFSEVAAPQLVSVEVPEKKGASLSEAEIVLCAGAGIKNADGWEAMKALAHRLNAAVCCTRNARDMEIGALDSDMVGVSGSSISPKVYIGFGVSGSAHHICGMKDSKLVLNINTDKNNPFFGSSDCGYVGDSQKVIAAVVEQLAKQ